MPIVLGELKVYNVKELSEILGLHEKVIRAMLGDGRLRGKKFGGAWYVSEQWLKDFFNTPDNLGKEEA